MMILVIVCSLVQIRTHAQKVFKTSMKDILGMAGNGDDNEDFNNGDAI